MLQAASLNGTIARFDLANGRVNRLTDIMHSGKTELMNPFKDGPFVVSGHDK